MQHGSVDDLFAAIFGEEEGQSGTGAGRARPAVAAMGLGAESECGYTSLPRLTIVTHGCGGAADLASSDATTSSSGGWRGSSGWAPPPPPRPSVMVGVDSDSPRPGGGLPMQRQAPQRHASLPGVWGAASQDVQSGAHRCPAPAGSAPRPSGSMRGRPCVAAAPPSVARSLFGSVSLDSGTFVAVAAVAAASQAAAAALPPPGSPLAARLGGSATDWDADSVASDDDSMREMNSDNVLSAAWRPAHARLHSFK